MNLDVAIATWNRADLLKETLDSLAALRVPLNVQWKIYVCDNNSSDHTRPTVEAFQQSTRGRLDVTYLFEPTQGKSYALNRLIRQTQGQWILFLDDDVLTDPGWLEAYTQGFAKYPQAACLGGPILPRLEIPATRHAAFLMREYPPVFGLLPLERDCPMTPPERSAWGANMAVRRDAFPKHGFATDRGMIAGARISGEDVGMIQNILDQGHQGWLLADAKVHHWIPKKSTGLRQFWRWQKGIGRAWIFERGKPTPGKFGVPWWAWKELARRAAKAARLWRPAPTRPFYDAVKDVAQYYGYLRAK